MFFFNFPPPINLSGILLRDWDLAKFRGKVNENTLYKSWDLAKVREDKLKKKLPCTTLSPLPRWITGPISPPTSWSR